MVDRAESPAPHDSLPLHESVLDRLGAEIAAGAIAPGARISSEEISARFDVSRTVAREVVRVLESLGMVSIRRRAGITVLDPGHWHALDPKLIRWQLAGPHRFAQLAWLAELRSGTEPLAARLAAANATPEQCATLTAAVMGMSATSRAANTAAYLEHDVTFHATLLAASGNPLLAVFAPIVREVLTGRTEHELMPAQANPQALHLHAAVAAAVQGGDGPAAEAAMREIVTESATAIACLRPPAPR
ncbi:FadR family transcriptional regulator [Nocardia yunnanensis]|uniref:FadR family transcriptional regulator n=1 Tax=Nocardia yunnanensis TaxID=2382165 RepID=A0A386ZGC7_9NOCA|nr:FCD domain-containing protein [Nocardia yunnanensis]AYF76952.1 FadR family transcriptional regulator [Nocardia yunnanensis]